MSKTKYILAIDQGTTGSRAAIYNKKAQVVASAYREFPQYFPKPGWVEHDPEEIWKSVNLSIQAVLKKVKPSQIEAIGITNQRETTLVWDRKTGKPIYNAIVWQCRRTAERCKRLNASYTERAYFRKHTGLPIDAYFSATKVEWILKSVKGAKKRAKEGGLCFGTTDSWVLWKLTGGESHATDHTNASRTMLFNIEKKEWDKAILDKFGVPESMLPEVKPSSGDFGTTAKIGALPEGIPVSGIAGDQQAALFGQRCFDPGSMKNTYGTGAFVLMNAGRQRPVSKHNLIVTLGCDGKGEPVYVLEGAIFVAGAAIQWLRDEMNFFGRAEESEAMALSVTDTAGVYFVPALVGLGAPYWDPDARGAIYGITRGTKREHIVRAAIEAMCFQTKDVLEAMKKDTGLKMKSLRVDGGASANDHLCSFQAGILGIDVLRPKITETTSLGAAYLAGLAVGYWKNSDDIKKCSGKDKVFKAKMSRKEAKTLYDGWKDSVQRTLTG